MPIPYRINLLGIQGENPYVFAHAVCYPVQSNPETVSLVFVPLKKVLSEKMEKALTGLVDRVEGTDKSAGLWLFKPTSESKLKFQNNAWTDRHVKYVNVTLKTPLTVPFHPESAEVSEHWVILINVVNDLCRQLFPCMEPAQSHLHFVIQTYYYSRTYDCPINLAPESGMKPFDFKNYTDSPSNVVFFPE